MWWDQEADCLFMQFGDSPPVAVPTGTIRVMRFRGPEGEIMGSIKFKVEKGDS